MVLPRFVEQAIAGRALTVYGDGTQTRCFCHVADTVQALLLLSESPEAVGGVFNVGSSDQLQIGELAERVIERAGSPSGLQYIDYADAYPAGFEEPARGRPNTAAVRRLTGWEPTRTVDEAIDELLGESAWRGGRPAEAVGGA
jgi:UDP-glucose 4-epimerase